MNTTKITATENGPYKAEHITNFKNSSGFDINVDDEMWLCRCGGSSNKPFCDGTHMKNDFSGQQDPEHKKDETIAYKGKNITIYDNRSICSHRGYCTTEVPNVFKEASPWINPDGDTVEKIIALCNKCPSGALSYSLQNQERVLGVNTEETTIKLAEKHYGFHGPYDVSGEVELKGQIKRNPESNLKVALCRCGHSSNKPFCSGAHYDVEFLDDKNK